MIFTKKKPKKRVLVIGLDGVPYFLLKDLAQRGVMPYVASLIDEGFLHKMKASLPEISSVSWTNFMTGSNPGQHGIFGFTDFKPDSYDIRFPNFLDVKTETFWDILGRENKKCIIINQPSTYPARRINGILIAGFVALELSKALYPLSYKAALDKIPYQIDIDTMKARENHEFLWTDLIRTLYGRQKAMELLWNEDWDYFEFVITGTDRLQHYLWNAYEDTSHNHHERFFDYYQKVDNVIGKIVSSFRKLSKDNGRLYLLSDHGFTGIKQEVYLNTWLIKKGYLETPNSSPKSLSDLSPSSLAFALDPNRIYINRKDRFPKGCVKPDEIFSLKRELTEKLEKLEYEGSKVVHKVFDTQEIYSGPQSEHGPDLIVLSEKGFDMKGSIKKNEIFGRSDLQGMHTWDDAFFWAENEYGADLSIQDLAKILLEQFS
ncbi:MAG: alkaline phosphatase family protein [Candidatus Aminicenantes bacterium]|nr:alkaline phosphatase family protein [Candidatus Aminicenantes bacterium]